MTQSEADRVPVMRQVSMRGPDTPSDPVSPDAAEIETKTGAGSGRGRRTLQFQPGLEGLRGLAVAAVLVFHSGFSWATGGFLGVSTFFTLSGYLITSLLINEHHNTGTVSLRAFWGRRFRRLLPASLVLLTAVVTLFAIYVAVPTQLDNLRGDTFSALAYIANWHFIWSGQSYQALFSAPSPLLHFWSLAIEEQFYLVFPLAMTLLLARTTKKRTLTITLTTLAALSTLEMIWLYNPTDNSRVYYGTDTRAAELLLGAVLAVALTNHTLLTRTWRHTLTITGTAATIAIIWLWHHTQQNNTWLYQGGLTAYAALTCIIIVAATQPGPLKTLLSNPALRWLGRISYGAYLYHWPIFLWLTPQRTGLTPWPLFTLRITITLTLAELSLRLIEKPVRDRKLLPHWQPLLAAPLAIALITALTITTTNTPQDPSQQIDLRPDPAQTAQVAPAEVPTTTTTLIPPGAGGEVPPAPQPPPLLPHATGTDLHALLVGDSTMVTLGGNSVDDEPRRGLMGWGQTTDEMTVTNRAIVGCGLARGGRQIFMGVEGTAGSDCRDWQQWFPTLLDGRYHPDRPDDTSISADHVTPQVVVALFGTWDVTTHQMAGDDQWRAIGDPTYDAYVARELALAMDTLTSRGSIVIWLTHPQIRAGYDKGLPADLPENDPIRMHKLNQIVEEVARTRPRVEVIDLAGYMASRPGGELDLKERPDGSHWSRASSDVMAQWLGPQIIKTYDRAWNEITAKTAAPGADGG